MDSPDVHAKIGAVYYEQGLYLKALDEFQLLRDKKHKKEILLILGRIYEILGRIDKAIQEINALMEMEPHQSVNLIVYLARLHSMNKQPEETVRLIEKAVKLNQGNDTLYHSLALAYMAVDQLDQAINTMRLRKPRRQRLRNHPQMLVPGRLVVAAVAWRADSGAQPS